MSNVISLTLGRRGKSWRMLLICLGCWVLAPAHAQQQSAPNLFEAIGKLLNPAPGAPPAADAAATGTEATETATTRNLRPVAASSSDERRIALVIGNNAYQNVTKLNNAAADARATAREFRALGFEVIEKIDSDQRGMKAAVREFVGKIGNTWRRI